LDSPCDEEGQEHSRLLILYKVTPKVKGQDYLSLRDSTKVDSGTGMDKVDTANRRPKEMVLRTVTLLHHHNVSFDFRNFMKPPDLELNSRFMFRLELPCGQ